ncbi:hypothetical protein F6V30_07975 [Oryzomonas sagensis]|uniref:Lipoprotein n=1 Tax=Oryzomonas sagensis TaxID=2603857 RepID=A0ABQ6TN72_9BACT|nr:hypothetical protein [Oryzomonas sagensis]KAB0670092.1 hypothetical protein F6V30_07975 [Oryzomonas sagensis]
MIWRVVLVAGLLLSVAACSKASESKTSPEKSANSSSSGVKKVAILIGQMKNPADSGAVYKFIADKLAGDSNVQIVTDNNTAQYWYMLQTYEPSSGTIVAASTFINFGNRQFVTNTGLLQKVSFENSVQNDIVSFQRFLKEN